MERPLVCAFTGHRPHRFPFGYDEKDARCQMLKNDIDTKIRDLIGEGVRFFISGMALGVDMWAAESVLKFKKEGAGTVLLCALPCADFQNQWDPGSQRRAHNIVSRADRVVTLARTYYPGCMLKRDIWMADRADVLLAVLNGSQACHPDRKTGGTAFTVDYALSKEKRIVLIDPEKLFPLPSIEI